MNNVLSGDSERVDQWSPKWSPQNILSGVPKKWSPKKWSPQKIFNWSPQSEKWSPQCFKKIFVGVPSMFFENGIGYHF